MALLLHSRSTTRSPAGRTRGTTVHLARINPPSEMATEFAIERRHDDVSDDDDDPNEDGHDGDVEG